MVERSRYRLAAEWEEQAAILMAWPHEQTDWVAQLDEVKKTYCEIIAAICQLEAVVLIVPNKPAVRHHLESAGINLARVHLIELQTDDTWARDFGPLCVQNQQGLLLLDFIFNGWGNKFNSEQDNQLTTGLVDTGIFGQTPRQPVNIVLEGGSIETDGCGTLLTTTNCLLEKNRNPSLSQLEIEQQLKELLGVEQVLWLEHGLLDGDDTDSHIDTLARFAPNRTIIFQGCRDPKDSHFQQLNKMAEQLSTFRDTQGNSYELKELPLPAACYDSANNRLPASYANFLIINGAVLFPTYDANSDQAALDIIGRAFPSRKIIPVDCRSLIQQHGSLHCVTMQLPAGVFP